VGNHISNKGAMGSGENNVGMGNDGQAKNYE